MGLIILLRHGQASFGAADYDVLSDLGREQARVAGEALRQRGLRDPLLVHGTLARQRDTARLAAEAMDLQATPIVDGRVDEYDHVGMVTQQARAAGHAAPVDTRAFQAVLDVALAGWVDADEPDGWAAFQGGAVAAMADLAAQLGAGRDAVVATSGGVIAAVVAHLLGGGPETVVALNRVTVNAGLTTVLVGRSGLSLLSFNEHTHLTGPNAALRTYR